MSESVERAIQHEVASWPDVTVTPHGTGFIEFRVGRREIGHLHGSRLADLPFPVRIRRELVAAGKGDLHHAHPESGWISYYIRGAHDVPVVVELFRLNYERPWLSSPGK